MDDPKKLLREISRHSYGSAERRDLAERAVAAADLSGDIVLRYDARYERMNTAVFGGEADVALAMFAWCQRTLDERPDVLKRSDLLWSYKHMMLALPKYARIGQNRIDDIASEMERRYQAAGNSMRPVYTSRAHTARYQGKVAESRALWEEAMRHPRDRYADCSACETHHKVALFEAEGKYDEAISAAAPILSGAVRCAEVPEATLPLVMRAHHALGQVEQARALRQRAYVLVSNNPDFIDSVSIHILLLVAEGDLEQAARIAAHHLHWLKLCSNDMAHEDYSRAVATLLQALLTQTDDAGAAPGIDKYAHLADALADSFGPSPEGNLEAQLREYLRRVGSHGMARAAALDERNGNRFYTGRWQDLPRPPRQGEQA